MVAESSPQQEHMVCALQERIGEVARGLGRRFGGLRACYTTLCPMFRARVTSILQMLPANQRKSSSSSKKTGALVAASTLTEGLARLRAKAEAMASRYAAVVHPGRPPYTLRRPKNLRRMVGEFQLKSPPARFGLANRKSWSTARPPPSGPTKWSGGVALEVLRLRESVRPGVTTCAEGPPS